MSILRDALTEIGKQQAQEWSIDYKDWTMIILEGYYKDYRYKHTCNGKRNQPVTLVIRVCEVCLTNMPDEVWDHFRKTQIFMEPARPTTKPNTRRYP